MATAQQMQASQVADDTCAVLKQGHTHWDRCLSEASTSAPQDAISEPGSDFSATPKEGFEADDNMLVGAKTGTISALLVMVLLPICLAWLYLPEPIALALVSFYVVTMLSCAIMPDVVSRGGCAALVLPSLYILAGLVFMAKQIPQM